MRHFSRVFVIVGFGVLVSACSVPLQVASLFADGISLFTTEKTVADHGISVVAQKDCAVWRGVSGGEICREPDEGTAIVAENKGTEIKAARVEFEKAKSSQTVSVSIKKQAVFPPPRPQARYPQAAQIKTAPPRVTANPKSAGMAKTPQTALVNKGLHLVLASFKSPLNANRFALKNINVKTRLVKAWAKGSPRYRVVVGPLAPEDRGAMRAHLASIGFKNVWSVRLNDESATSQLASAR